MAAEAKKRGLELLSVYPGQIPVQKSVAEGIAAMRQIIDNCVAAGIKSVLMGGMGNPKFFDAYYEAIAQTCDYAAEKKIPISVKPPWRAQRYRGAVPPMHREGRP